MITGKKKGF